MDSADSVTGSVSAGTPAVFVPADDTASGTDRDDSATGSVEAGTAAGPTVVADPAADGSSATETVERRPTTDDLQAAVLFHRPTKGDRYAWRISKDGRRRHRSAADAADEVDRSVDNFCRRGSRRRVVGTISTSCDDAGSVADIPTSCRRVVAKDIVRRRRVDTAGRRLADKVWRRPADRSADDLARRRTCHDEVDLSQDGHVRRRTSPDEADLYLDGHVRRRTSRVVSTISTRCGGAASAAVPTAAGRYVTATDQTGRRRTVDRFG